MVNISLLGSWEMRVVYKQNKKASKLTFSFGKIFSSNGYIVFSLITSFHLVSLPDGSAFIYFNGKLPDVYHHVTITQTILTGFCVSDFLSDSLAGDKINSVCSFLCATTQIGSCVHVFSLYTFSRKSCDFSGNPPDTQCCETSACLLSLCDISHLSIAH